MFIKSNGKVTVLENSALRLEDSNLNFNSSSKFGAENTALIEISNSELIFEDGSIIDQDDFYSYNITVEGQSSFYKSDFNLIEGSLLTLENDSKFSLTSGTTVTVPYGSNLVLNDGSELIIEDGANLVIEEGARVEINGNAKITGNVDNIYGRIAITDNSQLSIGSGSIIDFRYIPVSSVILGNNSELVVEADAILNYGPSTTTDCSSGSKITVQDGGTLTAGENSRFIGLNTWVGIVAEVGSTISTYFTSISNASWGINAQAASVNLTRTSFNGCENGLWLLNCDNYDVYDCYFNGEGTGTGIRVTESTGTLKSNTVQNHSSGIVAISCSPLISENYLHDNATCGIALYGYNTYPQLLNPSSTNDDLNNSIVNNGLTTTGENGSQIFMMYRANAYLNYGYNNIYSGNVDEIPAVPCIKTVSDMPENEQKVEVSQIVKIQADYNYWGTYDITEENRSDYFNLWVDIPKGYTIDYNPYAESAFEAGLPGTIHYSTNEPPSQEEQLLKVAMLLEDKGVYVASIKKYEAIIEKYPDSPEYYIATSRLPQVLAKEEQSLDPLIRTYDDAIASEEITNKKFIKGMKISTKIKGKKYDEAIALAEEMKLEATSEGEVLLADIDIAIANMMKDAENEGKGRSTVDHSATISKLLTKLTGDEEKDEEKTDIVESALPTEFTLYQNYPNPFNPTTEISYALSQDANVSIKVYSSNGSVVADLVNASQTVGNHSVTFDASKLSNGIFYYSLVANGRVVSTKKMLLLK